MTEPKKLPDVWNEFDGPFPDAKPPMPESKVQVENDESALQMIEKFFIRFRLAETAVQPHQKEWAEIDKFDRGEQWKDATSMPPWVPKPVTNYIRWARQLKRANLASVISRPTFMAEHDDDQDMVYMLQLAHDHVWDSHRVDRTVRRCIDRSLAQGTAIAYVYNDDSFYGGKYYNEPGTNSDPNTGRVRSKSSSLFQGDIRIKRWPNQNFFPDPDAYWLDDCKWIDTTELVNLRNVKYNPAFINYCKQQGTLDKLMKLNYTELEMEDTASGTIFERDYTPMETPRSIKGDEIVTLHTHWERYYKKGRWHLDVTYWMWNTNFILLRLEDVKPSEYPFAVLYDEEEENTFWGTSQSKMILDNQKLINKIQQVAAVIGALHQNPQKVVLRESGINGQEVARTGNLPGKTYVSNVPGEQAIQIIKPPDIPQGLFELDDRTQANTKAMLGISQAYAGESVGSLTTSSGYQDLINRATVTDRDKMTQIDEFVERISNLITLHILYKWKDKRTIARINSEGKLEFGQWTPVPALDAENITWRVRSDIYPKSVMSQSQRVQQADKLMQWQGQYNFQPPLITPEEWIRAQDLQDKDTILERIRQDRVKLEQQQTQDMAQQITQVADQIAQMKQQGASQQDIQAAAQQMAQELTQQSQMQNERNGMDTKQAPEVPQGVATPGAMQAMTAGH